MIPEGWTDYGIVDPGDPLLFPVHPDAEVLPDIRSQIRRMNALALAKQFKAAGELSTALRRVLETEGRG